MIAIIYILISALKNVVNYPNESLPSLLAVVKRPQDEASLILLLEPSNLFGMYSRVSIYHKSDDSGYELLIGYGSVLTIQGDGKIQIKIEEWTTQDEVILNGISNQTINIMKNKNYTFPNTISVSLEDAENTIIH